MTGFGIGRATVQSEEVSVELRSLNHKFCEVKARLPRELAPFETPMVKQIKDRIARGAIEVLVKRHAASAVSSVPMLDLSLAREYRRAFSLLAKEVGAPDDVRVQDIASQPGVMHLEERLVDTASAQKAVEKALEAAIAELVRMREIEGGAIRTDLLARVALVEASAKEIANIAPRAVDEHRARLADRIAELARGVAVDPQRLAQEVAFFAERTDIAEEMSRFASHIAQLRVLLASPEPAGRKMDFLVQEMHREINTTGSKSQHPEISTRVVSIKAELERLREQVQNVE